MSYGDTGSFFGSITHAISRVVDAPVKAVESAVKSPGSIVKTAFVPVLALDEQLRKVPVYHDISAMGPYAKEREQALSLASGVTNAALRAAHLQSGPAASLAPMAAAALQLGANYASSAGGAIAQRALGNAEGPIRAAVAAAGTMRIGDIRSAVDNALHAARVANAGKEREIAVLSPIVSASASLESEFASLARAYAALCRSYFGSTPNPEQFVRAMRVAGAPVFSAGSPTYRKGEWMLGGHFAWRGRNLLALSGAEANALAREVANTIPLVSAAGQRLLSDEVHRGTAYQALIAARDEAKRRGINPPALSGAALQAAIAHVAAASKNRAPTIHELSPGTRARRQAHLTPREVTPGAKAFVRRHTGREVAGLDAAAGVYVVEKGDSAWGIAQKLIGNGNRWPEMARVNTQHVPPMPTVWVGERLNVPTAWMSESAPAPSPTPAPAAAPAPAPAPVSSDVPPGMYRVLPGEYAYKIAGKLTGNPNRWPELIAANPQKARASDGNFQTLYAGEVIRLPASWLTGQGQPQATPVAPTPPATPLSPTVRPTVPSSAIVAPIQLPSVPYERLAQDTARGIEHAKTILAAWSKTDGAGRAPAGYGGVEDTGNSWTSRDVAAMAGFVAWWNAQNPPLAPVRLSNPTPDLDQDELDALYTWLRVASAKEAGTYPAPAEATPAAPGAMIAFGQMAMTGGGAATVIGVALVGAAELVKHLKAFERKYPAEARHT